MNYYAKAIQIIGGLDRKLTSAEIKIAMNHPSVFVKGFEPDRLYNVVLTHHGLKKIACIKEIRSITKLGLKEAKEMSESCPVRVVENVSLNEAFKIVKQLESIGASAVAQ